MAEHDEVYDKARADRLAEMLRALAERIRELDRDGHLLRGVSVRGAGDRELVVRQVVAGAHEREGLQRLGG